MKTRLKEFVAIVYVISTSLGAIIGAGFVSGRELVTYFGTKGYIIPLIICGITCVLGFILTFALGRRYSSVEEFNTHVFRGKKTFNFAVMGASFITLSGMLSAIDSVGVDLGLTDKIPIISIAFIILAVVISKRGIGLIKKLSLAIVPIIILITNFSVFNNGGVKLSTALIPSSNIVFLIVGGIAYASMNLFINLPIFIKISKNLNKRSLTTSAVVVSVLLCVQIIIILGFISAQGGNITSMPMPLLSGLKNGHTLYVVAFILAVFSSVVTSLYPLHNFVSKKGKIAKWCLYISLVCFSRLGIKNIVGYVYPLISAFGIVCYYKCAVFLVKEKRLKNTRIKTQVKAYNKVRIKGGN